MDIETEGYKGSKINIIIIWDTMTTLPHPCLEDALFETSNSVNKTARE